MTDEKQERKEMKTERKGQRSEGQGGLCPKITFLLNKLEKSLQKYVILDHQEGGRKNEKEQIETKKK